MACKSLPGQNNCQASPVHSAEEGAQVSAEDSGQHVIAPVCQVIRGGPATKHSPTQSLLCPAALLGLGCKHCSTEIWFGKVILTEHSGVIPKSNYLNSDLYSTTLILSSLVFQPPLRAEPGLDKICSLKKRWFKVYIKHLCCLHLILLWIYKEYSTLSDSAV